jgi:hypothetical protein
MMILKTMPEKFDGPSAWIGADLQTRKSEWLYTLSIDEYFVKLNMQQGIICPLGGM